MKCRRLFTLSLTVLVLSFNCLVAYADLAFEDTIPFRTITIDGYASDWSGINPYLADVQGDSTCGAGSDLKYLFLAKDNTYLYWRMDTWDGNYYNPHDAGPTLTFYQRENQKTTGDVQARVIYASYTGIFIGIIWQYNGSTWADAYVGSDYGVAENIAEGKIPLSIFSNHTFPILFPFYYSGVGGSVCDEIPYNQNGGMYVSGRRLYYANGNEIIMRGINHAHTWYRSETSSFANIKNTGANAVRVVLSSGNRWTRNNSNDVANVIQLCKTNQLICVLEVHDTTGYGEEPAAISLGEAISYWRSIQSVLTGEEAHVIINIGNEPYGNNNPGRWTSATINAISELRSAGFDHMIMVDAPNWGQDNSFTMRNNAAAVFNADPDRNTVFSVHMYGEFNTDSKINSYLSYFINNSLPIVIGEFGHKHSDGDPNENAIMALAQAHDIGYLGWSWSGNTGGVEYLDLVNNFDPNSLTWWGCRLIKGPNGIGETSQVCSGTPWILQLLDE